MGTLDIIRKDEIFFHGIKTKKPILTLLDSITLIKKNIYTHVKIHYFRHAKKKQ